MNLRQSAALIIAQVLSGSSLSDCLPEMLAKCPSKDRAFLQALCYGVCRWYFQLDFILHQLLEKPLKKNDLDIHCLLLVGLYQLMGMRIPSHAAVDQTVSATSELKKKWAKNLVNAVLRQYLRQKKDIHTKLQQDPVALYAHPAWLINKVKRDWVNWEAILSANNNYPPFALRVNQQCFARSEYLSRKKGFIMPETQSGIILEEPVNVDELPGFSTGVVSVQDGGAQLAAELLDVAPGQQILDACAAPGGKTAHILEIAPQVILTAVDRDEKRMQAVRDNLKRLQLNANCLVQDILTFKPKHLFDRILLDAPCTASGVIRRHPDIKLLRRESDIAKLSKQQIKILKSVWDLLKPNGLLVYATCSIFPEENVNILSSFLATTIDAMEEKIKASWGIECAIGRQILPGMHHMDGFYYARLRKGKSNAY